MQSTRSELIVFLPQCRMINGLAAGRSLSFRNDGAFWGCRHVPQEGAFCRRLSAIFRCAFAHNLLTFVQATIKRCFAWSRGLALLLASISGRAYVVLRSLFGFVRFRKRRRVCWQRYTCWPLQDAIICKQLNWKTLPLEGSMACMVHDFFRRTRMARRKSAPIGYVSCVVLHFFMASKHSIELIWVCLVLGKYTVW